MASKPQKKQESQSNTDLSIPDAKLKIEQWPIEKVINYARNARLHSDDQVKAIAASIKEFGFINPCLVDASGTLIAGHGRVMACKSLAIKTVPVIKLGHLSEDQIKALRIADNQLPMLASWSTELLRAELIELKASDYPIQLLGFDDVQLVSFMAMPRGEDPEVTPPLPPKPIAARGEIWLLGRHRIMCGDCLKEGDIRALMAEDRLDLVFSDPPYNVAYVSNRGGKSTQLGSIENDDQDESQFEEWIASALASIAGAMRPQACIYICHPDSASGPKLAFEKAFAECFKKSSTVIWVKQSAGMGWQDYRAQHEPILYGWKEGKGKHFYAGDRAKTTVWSLDRDPQVSYLHPTQKPVALAEEAILNSSKPGWSVGDFFAGSGSTLIACEKANRRFFGMEIDPRFCSVIIERWEEYSGADAILEGDGRTYKAIKSARWNKRTGAGKSRRASSGGGSNSSKQKGVSERSRPPV